MENAETAGTPALETLRQRLNSAHAGLLRIHKALLDHEQARYTRENGPMGGPNDVLQLVVKDPWFAWLRPLTSLIVEIDEFVSAKKPPNPAEGVALLSQARSLMVPAENGEPFQREYFRSLQESPEVALAQGEWKLALMQMGLKD